METASKHAIYDQSIEWDEARRLWRCHVGGQGNVVLYCREKWVLERMLDEMENANQ